MRRRLLLGGLVFCLILAGAGYAYYKNETEPAEKRGSASEEFDAKEPEQAPKAKKKNPIPWPEYGFDPQRTHVSPYDHRPPYRRLWSIDGHDTLEFPPSVGHNKVFLAQQKGMFFVLNSKNGKVVWKKSTKRCAASSPAVGKKFVYVAYMDYVNCPQSKPGATGYVAAWNVKNGREKWRFKGAPVESSPLLRDNTLYVGSWDRKVYALNAKNGRKKWAFQADEEVNSSPAYWKGTIFIATDAGSVYAINAKTGKQKWKAQSQGKFGSREFFYATPTIAYGRVYIGNTDGTMYVFGAKSGKLLWAKPLGTYIYGAAGVWKRTVYVGTYDGNLYALDAATGDEKWKIAAPAAIHSAPTIMKGLVYYASCSSCGRIAARAVKKGPDGTYAVNARTGKQVWRFRDGKFANPVVADQDRIYVTGRAFLYAFKEKKAKKKAAAAKKKKEKAAD